MAGSATQSEGRFCGPEHRSVQIIGRPVARDPMPISYQKWGIVEEELDECLYWLELLADTKTVEASRLKNLEKEANELLSIAVSSIKTARLNSRIRNKSSEKK